MHFLVKGILKILVLALLVSELFGASLLQENLNLGSSGQITFSKHSAIPNFFSNIIAEERDCEENGNATANQKVIFRPLQSSTDWLASIQLNESNFYFTIHQADKPRKIPLYELHCRLTI